jgi:NADPH:quinone reductase-like Zn-dependent oxidoreductase
MGVNAMIALFEQPEVHRAAREEVVRALAEGGVSPQIGATFGLEEAPDALIALGERRLAGKGVLVVKHGSAG